MKVYIDQFTLIHKWLPQIVQFQQTIIRPTNNMLYVICIGHHINIQSKFGFHMCFKNQIKIKIKVH